VTDKPWQRARLIPVSGISGPDEQEQRGVSVLLAVINSVRESGRGIIGDWQSSGQRPTAACPPG
jgi:hypothetical protein